MHGSCSSSLRPYPNLFSRASLHRAGGISHLSHTVSGQGLFAGPRVHTNHLLRPGYPSPRDRPSGWTGLSFWYFSVALLQKHSAQKVSVHPLLYDNTLKLKKKNTHTKKTGSEPHGGKCKKRQPHHKLISDIERINPTGKTNCGQDRKAPICHTGPL